MSPPPSDEDISVASPKRGRKESEQRRRVMMNQYFDELIALLSMLSERCIPKKMDKATTLHEAVQCIQIYSDLTSKPDKTLTLDIPKTPKPSKAPKSPVSGQTGQESSVQGLHTVGELLHFFLDAHDAFLMVVSDSGRVLFSTELITSLLGHMQTRLVGQNFFDFVHENDHSVFHDVLKLDQSGCEGIKLKDRPIIAFPPQLVQCHLKLYSGETGYFPQYLQFKSVVYLRKWDTERAKGMDMFPASPSDHVSESSFSGDPENQSCLVIIGKLPTSLSMIDLPIGTNDVNFEFEMRVSREGRIIDVDKHAVTVLGFMTSEIIGTSFFDYVDPYHLMDVSEGMSTFLSSGLGTTTPYRLLTKGGRSIWLISKGYLSYNPWNNKPDHILLTNRILGCDQVLPEHRFFRSRKLLPDMEGLECYIPNIQLAETTTLSSASPTPAVCSTAVSTGDSAVHCNVAESQFNLTGMTGTVSHQIHQHQPQQLQPHQQYQQQQHQQQQQQQQLPPFQPLITNTQPMQQQQQQQQQLPQQGDRREHMPPTPQSAPPGPSTHSPAPSVQSMVASPAGIVHSQVASPTVAGSAPSVPHIQNFDDVQRELDRKNRELFDLHRKLLEQQQLFEKERSQFYSITAQVMNCIGSNALNQLPPNMQMVFTAANNFNPSSTPSNAQSKIVMADTLTQPAVGTNSPISVASVRTPSESLWDSGVQVSIGGYTDNSSQFSLQQTQQQQQTQQPQTQHQMQPSPYGGTPPTSLPVSSVNFTISDYLPVNTASVTSVQGMPQEHSNNMLSERFGLSQGFKMSGHQSLAEHNLQFYHQIPQQSGQTGQTTGHLPSAVSRPPAGFGGLMSNDVLSNLASPPTLPTLPIGMQSQKPQQRTLPSESLADILNSTRFP